jgi:outer membrane lipoprotein carrier protein
MMKLRTYVVTVSTALLLFSAHGLAAPVKAVVTGIQQKYDNIASMKAEFTQVLIHKESGSKESRNGTLFFKKPLLVRWESKKPSPELLLVTNREIWNVFPDEEVAYKYPLSLAQDSRSIVRVITGQARLDQDFLIEEEGKENALIRLHLFPKEPVQALVEAVLWIDPMSNLIKKLRIYDVYGNENEITFVTQDIDAKVRDALFHYTPEKGILVEDRTKKGIAPQKPLMR